MLKKLTICGAAAIALAAPSAALAGILPVKGFVSDRLLSGSTVSVLGGLPVNGVFLLSAVLVTAALVTFWMLMLVDCLKRHWPGRLLWSAILMVSLPLGLYWLSALLYYVLVKMEEGRPAGWRQRLTGHFRNAAARLGRRPRH